MIVCQRGRRLRCVSKAKCYREVRPSKRLKRIGASRRATTHIPFPRGIGYYYREHDHGVTRATTAAEPGVAPRPGPHSCFARHHAVGAAPAGELFRSATKREPLPATSTTQAGTG